jgi:hypothetical protein
MWWRLHYLIIIIRQCQLLRKNFCLKKEIKHLIMFCKAGQHYQVCADNFYIITPLVFDFNWIFFQLKSKRNNVSFAWRRPTLTGGILQLPSALRSLTSVLVWERVWPSRHRHQTIFIKETYFAEAKNFVPSKLDNVLEESKNEYALFGITKCCG